MSDIDIYKLDMKGNLIKKYEDVIPDGSGSSRAQGIMTDKDYIYVIHDDGIGRQTVYKLDKKMNIITNVGLAAESYGIVHNGKDVFIGRDTNGINLLNNKFVLIKNISTGGNPRWYLTNDGANLLATWGDFKHYDYINGDDITIIDYSTSASVMSGFTSIKGVRLATVNAVDGGPSLVIESNKGDQIIDILLPYSSTETYVDVCTDGKYYYLSGYDI